MLEIKEITDKMEWEDFMSQEVPHTFLQSWNWGEFHRLMGDEVWRLGIYDKDLRFKIEDLRLIGVMLVVKISARRGKFLFIPHGPIFKKNNHSISGTSDVPNIADNSRTSDVQKLEALVDYLKTLAKQENCSFIRISPILGRTPSNEKLFKDLGFRLAPIHMHAAELVWILDVNQTEETILRGMRKTTRYLIYKAEKDGVEIIKSDKPEDLAVFNKIYEETARRQHFTPYSEKFLKSEFDAFSGLGSINRTKGEGGDISFFFAKYHSEIVSAAMVIFYGDSAYYHQGASSHKYPKIPAPYLLQWEIIREAKNRGLKFYNFWGISPSFAKAPASVLRTSAGKSEGKPENQTFKKHPWDGLSLFKTGFGGFSEEYLPAQDLVLKPSYWLTYLIEKARKAKRNL